MVTKKKAPKKQVAPKKTAASKKTSVKKPKLISQEHTEQGKVTVIKIAPLKVPKFLEGFMDFVRQQGIVGLAVGLTIGTSVTVFVKSIVDNMINPIIGLLLPGGSDLASRYICLSKAVDGTCTNKLGWGAVVSSLISFLTIAAVVYFMVHLLKLDRLDKKK